MDYWLPREAFTAKCGVHGPRVKNIGASSCIGGFGVLGHGVRVGIRVNDETVVPELMERLPQGVQLLTPGGLGENNFNCVISVIRDNEASETPKHAFHLIHHQLEHSVECDREADLLTCFDTWLEWAIATLAPGHVFVHAGAVAWQGRGIIIPGVSYSGKSTLVTELVYAGATYLSDEFAILDCDGRVYPYPRPITMRPPYPRVIASRAMEGSGSAMAVPVEAFGGTVGTCSVPARLIVLTGYKKGASWQPTTLSPGRSVLELLSHTPAGRIAPERVLLTLLSVAERATTISSPRGEAEDFAPHLLDLVND